MTKREFLEDLRKYLSGKLPESTVDGHVAYYRNYIENEIKNGRSEAQVMSGLGDPRMIGRTILDTSPEQQNSGYEYSAYRTDNDGSESQKKRKKSQTGCFFDTSTVFGKIKLAVLLVIILAVIFVIIRFAVRLLIYLLPVIIIACIISAIMRRR